MTSPPRPGFFPLPGVTPRSHLVARPWTSRRGSRSIDAHLEACLKEGCIAALNSLDENLIIHDLPRVPQARSPPRITPVQRRFLAHITWACARLVRRLRECDRRLTTTDCDSILFLLEEVLLLRPPVGPSQRDHGVDPPPDNLSMDVPYFLYGDDAYLPKQLAARFIIADRVSVPDQAATCCVLPFLSPEKAALYTRPENLLLPPGERKVSRYVFMVSPPEYVRLLTTKLFPAGMIVYMPPELVKCVNGIFAVDKTNGSLRLIIDARPLNAMQVDPAKPDMAHQEHLANLRVPPGMGFLHMAEDVRNMFHALYISPEYASWQALPPVRAGEVGALPFAPDALVHPCVITLMMGWKHSVDIAQDVTVSRANLTAAGHSNRITVQSDLRLDRPRSHIYVDDSNFLVPFALDCPAALPAAVSVALELRVRYRSVVEDAALECHDDKALGPTPDPSVALGLELSGREGLCVPKPQRLLRLILVTAALLRRGRASGHFVSRVVSCWTNSCLVVRPLLSVFFTVYRFIAIADMRTFVLWPSVRMELAAVALLAPLIVSNLRAGFYNRVVCFDASSAGQGVVAARVSSSSAEALADMPPTLDVDDWTRFAAPLPGRVVDLPWTTIVSSRWRLPEHINVLEARAYKTSLRWLITLSGAVGKRLVLFTDSSVVRGCVQKGRSSSSSLKPVLRSCAALVLASGCRPVLNWIPTSVNPADKPSRELP